MYLSFYGLKQAPFSIAPDPRYLFLSERHREALAHLLYGLRGGGGFVLLSGEIGAGKTTLCRGFLDQVPENTRVAYIFNPKLDALELLRTICDEFNIGVPHQGPGMASLKDHIDALNRFLLKVHAQGGHSVLVIDEAQNLSADVLEQLRLLTNLETPERKLLQIILIGQPELRLMLARPELEQLAQRVIARYHLGALTEEETTRYVTHRLAVAGREGELPFDARALRRLHALSRGVPRRINLLADRALLGAYATGLHRVDAKLVDKAADEVFGPDTLAATRSFRRRTWLYDVMAGMLLSAGVWGGWWLSRDVAPAVASSAAARSAGASAAARTASVPGPAPQTVPVGEPAASATLSPPGVSALAAPGAAATNAAPAAPALDLTHLPFAARDEAAAWRDLAHAWGETLPTPGEPCALARRSTALQCARSSMPLPLIQKLDRPGLLVLRDAQGGTAFVRLLALSDSSASLQVGEARAQVSLSALAQVWSGDFATLWRAPASYTAPIAAGQSGPAVDALATGLARWAGQPAPVPGAPLDAARVARLQAFQRAQGLPADGVAGPATFMQLNRLHGVSEPRLNAAAPAH